MCGDEVSLRTRAWTDLCGGEEVLMRWTRHQTGTDIQHLSFSPLFFFLGTSPATFSHLFS